jgi:Putative Flp pilus-assembly TadE/G-like
MKHSRGQVIPLWIVAILSTFVLMFMALNYGNTIRWQVRAQTAADAAVQALTSIQTQRFNMMTETLYSLNIEEFRLRRLLDATLMTANLSGGCNYSGLSTYCSADYALLTAAFVRSASRYTYDAQVLNNVTSYSTYANWQNDAQALLHHIQSTCNQPAIGSLPETNLAGGDCAFQYTMLPITGSTLRGTSAGTGYQTPLNPVEFDVNEQCIPSFGRVCDANEVNSQNVDFNPVQVEVLACAVIPPIIPAFGALQTQPYYAVGRAAATSVMVEEDWFQPGALYDISRAGFTHFQFEETYGTSVPPSGTSGMPYDWYGVDYGGNGAVASATFGGFAQSVYTDEMSVRLGWWNSVPMKPFTPASQINLTTMCSGA